MPIRLRPLVLAALAATQLGAPVAAQDGLAGPYLAGQVASFHNDYEAAAQYYAQALLRDPSNLSLLENATLAFIGLGQVDKAVPIARRIQQAGASSQAADMVLLADQVKRGRFDALLDDQEAGLSIGPLADRLLSAWAQFGAGRMSEAINGFDEAANDPGLGLFGAYHKALALASVGDFEGAVEIFESGNGDGLRYTRRGAMANIAVLSQLERNDEARQLITDLFGRDLDPGMADIAAKLDAGEALPFETIRDGADGAAEVFFTVAEAVNGEADDAFTLLYARLAEFLRPDHVDAILLSADLLEAQQRYDLAARAYAAVPVDDPAYYAAELGRANTLERSGKPDAAVEVLASLAKDYPSVPIVQTTLGDTLSGLRRFEEATAAYDAAIGLFSETTPSQWYIYYARGITFERRQLWPQAEADFRKALELSPDQPRVLNYLGYSLVEKRIKLDEALDMIERAVAGRPDDGYITDSLGWVLYRLGRFDEAVPHMERAVELMPIDPIINDHLGDVLWKVGRKLEAEFQWKRALSLVDPEDIPVELSPERIRRKLDVGLDVVLDEEGAEPLSVADGN
ncbi:hypothetical protein ACMU_10185 [Actibacterium mucosum KCTC 23349]|uniref:Tetratricopeptide TPR_2 n=1 Tax=Actibacterium mucosum KCTC 23349 TaxID=1454373 RepID=A0A037ZI39_9RHOB|nr:tetratricopeptide repeat protein [Actibacterium mucosum]KAJ56115.1 hypothetical protein ACMU_10185 [Actibacterium mucosum KCTC 23349]